MKRFAWVGLLAASLQTSFGFALFGPGNEEYQVPTIGYMLGGDLGAPKNLGEEYRWNTPTLYYAFDQNFLDYFGTDGVIAVEQAISILNSLTNVSMYSNDLSEWPMETLRANFRAQALGLLDLKTVTLSLFMEQLGLANPQRFVWSLHNRFVRPGGQCPQDMVYDVIKRNFDPVFTPTDVLQPSSYVNGALFTYRIFEICTGPNPLADAVEVPVDPLANTWTAVASRSFDLGQFFLGLTRDDVGGLRYLLRTNNMNVESAGDNTFTVVTNNNVLQLLVTSNLTDLIIAARTNTAAELEDLFPGLVVAATTNSFTNVVTTNITAYFTNYPWSPVGSFASVAFATNRFTNVVTLFHHTFANVVTNTHFTHGFVTLLTTNVGPCGGFSPPDALCTNVTRTTVFTDIPMGDFYIIPTNACAMSIVSTQLTQVLSITNVLFAATNNADVTNATGLEFSRSIITYFTNRVFLARPVLCLTNTVALRQGIEKITFVRRDFDSLLGQFFMPVTNTYFLNAVTNSVVVPQRIDRVVVEPDFLFSAYDIAPGPGEIGPVWWFNRTIRFNTNNSLARLAGPGLIEPSVRFSFNKVGPIYQNMAPNFLDEATQSLWFIWGSFDGSTNAPIVFPNGTSITNLENQVLINISNVSLPDGEFGADYTAQFTVQGGTPPYTWSIAPNSPALPPGLILSPAGAITGVPEEAGIYDFVVRLTDAGQRIVERAYTITIIFP
jgi:hypothetical protein